MKIALGLLAAGESKRFGSLKQLKKFSEKTLFEIALQAVTIKGFDTFIVTGKSSKKVKALTRHECLFNSQFTQGIGSSIACLASRALQGNYEALLIHLCDLPLVTSEDIQNLMEAYEADPESPIASQLPGTLAPPCIFPKSFFNELTELQGDRGAKSLLINSNARSFKIKAAHYDIDTPDDLKLIYGLALAKKDLK